MPADGDDRTNENLWDEMQRLAGCYEGLKDSLEIHLGNINTAIRALPCPQEGEKRAQLEERIKRLEARPPSAQLQRVSERPISEEDIRMAAEEAATEAVECSAADVLKQATEAAQAAADAAVARAQAAQRSAEHQAVEDRRKAWTWRLSTIAAVIGLATTVFGGLGAMWHYLGRAEARAARTEESAARTAKEVRQFVNEPKVVYIKVPAKPDAGN
jgi:type IV secretory pathway VirB10-like protein